MSSVPTGSCRAAATTFRVFGSCFTGTGFGLTTACFGASPGNRNRAATSAPARGTATRRSRMNTVRYLRI